MPARCTTVTGIPIAVALVALFGCAAHPSFTLRVYDGRTGEPVPGAIVHHTTQTGKLNFSPQHSALLATSPSGEVLIETPSERSFYIECTAPGFHDRTIRVKEISRKPAPGADRVISAAGYVTPSDPLPPINVGETLTAAIPRRGDALLTLALPEGFRGVVYIGPPFDRDAPVSPLNHDTPIQVPRSGHVVTKQFTYDRSISPAATLHGKGRLRSEFFGERPSPDETALRTVYRFSDPQGSVLSASPHIFIVGTAVDADRIANELFPPSSEAGKATHRPFKINRLGEMLRAQSRQTPAAT